MALKGCRVQLEYRERKEKLEIKAQVAVLGDQVGVIVTHCDQHCELLN